LSVIPLESLEAFGAQLDVPFQVLQLAMTGKVASVFLNRLQFGLDALDSRDPTPN